MNKYCKDCAHCNPAPSGNLNEATCDAVTDPFTGTALNVKVARRDEWDGMYLGCGYAGAKWEAKQ